MIAPERPRVDLSRGKVRWLREAAPQDAGSVITRSAVGLLPARLAFQAQVSAQVPSRPMSGDIFFSSGECWSARSSVFYWVVDELAGLVTDSSLAEHLREISAENLGCLDIAALPPAHQVQLRQALRCMPERGRSRLPDTQWRMDLARQFEELATHAGRDRPARSA